MLMQSSERGNKASPASVGERHAYIHTLGYLLFVHAGCLAKSLAALHTLPYLPGTDWPADADT